MMASTSSVGRMPLAAGSVMKIPGVQPPTKARSSRQGGAGAQARYALGRGGVMQIGQSAMVGGRQVEQVPYDEEFGRHFL